MNRYRFIALMIVLFYLTGCKSSDDPQRYGKDLFSSFHEACLSDDTVRVLQAAEANGDIDRVDSKLGTFLHIAVKTKNLRAIEKVLLMGANIHLADTDGLSPADYALQSNDQTVRELFGVLTGERRPELALQKSFDLGISAVSITPDNKFLVVCDETGEIFIIDYRTNNIIRTIRAHSYFDTKAVLTKDSSQMITTCREDFIKVWDFNTGNLIRKTEDKGKMIYHLALSEDNKLLAVSSEDNLIKLRSYPDLKVLSTIKTAGIATSLQFVNSDKTLLAGDTKGALIAYDLDNPGKKRIIRRHSSQVHFIRINKQINRLICAYADGSISIMKLENFEEIKNISNAHAENIKSLEISPDGSFFISTGFDKTLKVWNTADGELEQSAQTAERIKTLCFVPGSSFFYTGGSEEVVRLWNLKSLKVSSLKPAQFESVKSIIYEPGRGLLACGTYEGELHVWQKEGKKYQSLSEGLSRTIYYLAYQEEQDLLFSSGYKNPVNCWNVAGGQLNWQFREKQDSTGIGQMAINPAGTLLAVSTYDNGIEIYNLPGGEHRFTLETPGDGRPGTVFFTSNHRLYSVDDFGTVLQVWDAETEKLLLYKKLHNRKIIACTYNREQKQFLTTHQGGEMILWDSGTLQEIKRIYCRDVSFHVVAMNRSATLAATVGVGDIVKVYSLKTGKLLFNLDEHNGWIDTIEFHEEKNMLISGSTDKQTIFWDLETGKPRLYMGLSGRGRGIIYTPDGKYDLLSPGSSSLLGVTINNHSFDSRIFEKSLMEKGLLYKFL